MKMQLLTIKKQIFEVIVFVFLPLVSSCSMQQDCQAVDFINYRVRDIKSQNNSFEFNSDKILSKLSESTKVDGLIKAYDKLTITLVNKYKPDTILVLVYGEGRYFKINNCIYESTSSIFDTLPNASLESKQ